MTARPVASSSSSTRQIARAAVLVMGLFLLSRVTGLAREMIIGARFGTSAQLDAYQAAFRVPDLLFQLVAGGALGSAFIPVFAGCLARRDLKGGWRLFSAVVNLVLILLTTLAALFALSAPWLVRTILAPGFSTAQQALTAELVRWMRTARFSARHCHGRLNSFQHFLLPAGVIIYNLSIIAGAWFLAPTSVCLARAGALSVRRYTLTQLLGLWWHGARYKPTLFREGSKSARSPG
jgi:putative peptidoglycan lipid II flippase